MLLLLHALIPCLAAYILHLFLYFLALSSLAYSANYRQPSVPDSVAQPKNVVFNWFFLQNNCWLSLINASYFKRLKTQIALSAKVSADPVLRYRLSARNTYYRSSVHLSITNYRLYAYTQRCAIKRNALPIACTTL